MTNKLVNIQDNFLNQIRKDNIPVVVYLVNGFQIRGMVRAFDNYTVVIESEGKMQLIYKHAVSTFTPARNVRFDMGVTASAHAAEPANTEA
ncbi:MAG: RNA chaperone Hfq [Firmicutes bacterium]|nr:RNA chaperone Hfq [Bacillota bacterium]